MQNVIETIKEKNGTLLDVRSPMEFDTEHVPGAINIPLDTIEMNIKNISILPKPIIVYCLSGGRSGVATNILQQNGVSEIYNGGGIYNLLSILNNN
jgi:phage shock protein E